MLLAFNAALLTRLFCDRSIGIFGEGIGKLFPLIVLLALLPIIFELLTFKVSLSPIVIEKLLLLPMIFELGALGTGVVTGGRTDGDDGGGATGVIGEFAGGETLATRPDFFIPSPE